MVNETNTSETIDFDNYTHLLKKTLSKKWFIPYLFLSIFLSFFLLSFIGIILMILILIPGIGPVMSLIGFMATPILYLIILIWLMRVFYVAEKSTEYRLFDDKLVIYRKNKFMRKIIKYSDIESVRFVGKNNSESNNLGSIYLVRKITNPDAKTTSRGALIILSGVEDAQTWTSWLQEKIKD